MSELAYDLNGEPVSLPASAQLWRVRRFREPGDTGGAGGGAGPRECVSPVTPVPGTPVPGATSSRVTTWPASVVAATRARPTVRQSVGRHAFLG